MNDIKKSHHLYGESESKSVQQDHSPYWKRAHRDWRIWVAVLLMIAGMIIYVMSEDLSSRPLSRPQQPQSGAVGK
jgi:hypothetical protein